MKENERITKAAIAERIEAVEKNQKLKGIHFFEIRQELAEIRFLIERDVFFGPPTGMLARQDCEARKEAKAAA